MDTQQQLQEIIELLRPISASFQQHPLHPHREEEASLARRPTKKEKDEAFRRQVVEHLELRSHAHVLQQQFGLLQPPHKSRVRQYLQTHDPRVFDGLRRREN